MFIMLGWQYDMNTWKVVLAVCHYYFIFNIDYVTWEFGMLHWQYDDDDDVEVEKSGKDAIGLPDVYVNDGYDDRGSRRDTKHNHINPATQVTYLWYRRGPKTNSSGPTSIHFIEDTCNTGVMQNESPLLVYHKEAIPWNMGEPLAIARFMQYS